MQRLYLMQVAHLEQYNMPIVCYLAQLSDGQNILIDSGVPDNPEPPPDILARLRMLNLTSNGRILNTRPPIGVSPHCNLNGDTPLFAGVRVIEQESTVLVNFGQDGQQR